jgi:F-type H+-transporting ATPase subunit b
MKRSRLVSVGACLALLFCLVVNSLAAEEGGGAAAAGANTAFRWINFAIVAGLLIWVFAKLLPGWFRHNADTIASAITKATAAKEAADREVREAETRLAQLEQEIAALRAVAEREAAGEAERIRALAKSDAAKVATAAQAEIEAAERAARLELRRLAAALAVDGAESLLVKQLTAAAQENLVDVFVKGLDGRPN